jgi:lycopene cyclase domain-containing protein
VTREYTALAAISVVAVLLVEMCWLRTGLLRSRAYWIAIGICYGFMIAVNGWLTKRSAPIVLYDERRTTGWRFPWDIPVEDYLFGFALLTLTMLTWDALGAKARARGNAGVPSRQ